MFHRVPSLIRELVVRLMRIGTVLWIGDNQVAEQVKYVARIVALAVVLVGEQTLVVLQKVVIPVIHLSLTPIVM